jgi:U3 small nucleolar RNA-associated protein 13
MAPLYGESLQLKKNYKATAKLEVFYTGGSARVSRDGKVLACTCNEDVKVRPGTS